MKCFTQTSKNIVIVEDFRYNNVASFHEGGNRNEIVHAFFQTIANTKLISL